jgi:hypothetical protein
MISGGHSDRYSGLEVLPNNLEGSAPEAIIGAATPIDEASFSKGA